MPTNTHLPTKLIKNTICSKAKISSFHSRKRLSLSRHRSHKYFSNRKQVVVVLVSKTTSSCLLGQCKICAWKVAVALKPMIFYMSSRLPFWKVVLINEKRFITRRRRANHSSKNSFWKMFCSRKILPLKRRNSLKCASPNYYRPKRMGQRGLAQSKISVRRVAISVFWQVAKNSRLLPKPNNNSSNLLLDHPR